MLTRESMHHFLMQHSTATESCFTLSNYQVVLQTILKTQSDLIENDIELFAKKIKSIYGDSEFEISFCYRMRIGVIKEIKKSSVYA